MALDLLRWRSHIQVRVIGRHLLAQFTIYVEKDCLDFTLSHKVMGSGVSVF